MKKMFKTIGIVTICLLVSGGLFAKNNIKEKSQFILRQQQQTIMEAMINIQKMNDKSLVFHVFLDTEIQGPRHYRSVFKYLKLAQKTDHFIFYLNTYGGNAFTAVQLYNAIKNSKAQTIAEVTNAQSAGCMIMMACNKIKVNQFAMVMMHQWSGGARGKVSIMATRSKAYNKLMKVLIPKMFKGLFTRNEIKYILNGGEVYLIDNEIKYRLKRINKLF